MSDASNANRTVPQQVRVAPLLRPDGKALVLHCVEGLALIMLCQSRLTTRKLAVAVLKETKQMLPLLCVDEVSLFENIFDLNLRMFIFYSGRAFLSTSDLIFRLTNAQRLTFWTALARTFSKNTYHTSQQQKRYTNFLLM